MILPTIHINGTAARDLYKDLVKAAQATRDAADAISNAAPNGRDYYPQGADAYREAAKEHAARLSALQKISGELQAILEHVADHI